MTRRRNVLIVGGALSGPTAAARARETDEAARIVLLERAPDVSYAVAGLAYHVSGEVDSLARLNRERAEYFRDVYDIEARTGVEVTSIDARRHLVHAGAEALAYDSLVFAAGVESLSPEIAGLEGARNVFRFRSLAHLRSIMTALRRAKSVAVIGGGFYGVEAADGFLRRKLKVSLVERGPRLLPAFATGASAAAAEALRRAGADVITSATIETVHSHRGAVRALHLGDGRHVECDLVIVAAGVRPRTELLGDAGARLLRDGSVRVDDGCRTNLPDVFACGVCLSLEHAVTGRLVWLPQASIADKTAQVAGANAAGGNARVGKVLGTAIVRAGELTIARTGLARDEAERADTASVHAPARDVFFPGSSTVSMELLYDPATGRVLGADAWGASGVDKRIDVLATAIAGGLTAADIAQLDLGYAPPFSCARDVVNVAGSVAEQSRVSTGIAWSCADVALRADRVALVDVRSPAARRDGVVPGARTSSLAELRAHSDELTGVQGPLVFVSDDGGRGYLAARIARARGLGDAGYLAGGMASWVAEGRPLAPARDARPAIVPPPPPAKSPPAKTPAPKSPPAKIPAAKRASGPNAAAARAKRPTATAAHVKGPKAAATPPARAKVRG